MYGHLHAEGHRFVVEEEIAGIKFTASCDHIDFKPKRYCKGGCYTEDNCKRL